MTSRGPSLRRNRLTPWLIGRGRRLLTRRARISNHGQAGGDERVHDRERRRRRGPLREHRCARRVPAPDGGAGGRAGGADADPCAAALGLRAGHRPLPRADRGGLPAHARDADLPARRRHPHADRARGGARRTEDPRSHRNEGDEPVELWAISRKTDMGDATKLDDFWEASPTPRRSAASGACASRRRAGPGAARARGRGVADSGRRPSRTRPR